VVKLPFGIVNRVRRKGDYRKEARKQGEGVMKKAAHPPRGMALLTLIAAAVAA